MSRVPIWNSSRRGSYLSGAQNTSLELTEVESHRRFSIRATDRFWVVESGALDLFAVEPARDGERSGALRQLLRLQPGQAAFGVPALLSALDLVAIAGPNSAVSVCSISQHVRLSLDNGASGVLVPLLEEWISNSAAAIIREGIPQRYAAIACGDRVASGENKLAILPVEKVSWVEQGGGQILFLGQESAALPGDGCVFPVSRAGWIECQPDTEARAADPRRLLVNGALLRGLNEFHAHLWAYLEASLAVKRAKEQDWLRRKTQSDARSLRFALSELASPLKDQREIGAYRQGLDTPLFKIFQAIGKHLDIEFKSHPDLIDGNAVSDPVAAIARASGVRLRRVALKGRWSREAHYPLLVFDAEKNPMALLPDGKRGFRIYDPRHPGEPLLDPAVAAALDPFGYSFYRPFPHESVGVLELMKFGIKGCQKELSSIVIMGIVTGLLALAVPVATGFIFDSLIPGAQRTELLLVCTVLLAIVIASSLCMLARGSAVLRLEGKMDLSIQAAVWDRLLALPVRFFRDYAAGDLAARSLGIAEIRRVLTSTTLSSILSGLFSVFSATLLFYYSSRLAFIALGLTGFAFLFTIGSAYVQLRVERRSWSISGLIAGIVLEFITGVAKLRVAGAEQRAFVVWVKHFAAQKRADRSSRRVSGNLLVFNAFYPVFCVAVIFVSYGQAQTQGGLSTGQFLAFLTAFTQFLGAVLTLGSSLVAALAVIPLYERAAPIVQAIPEGGAVRGDPGELQGRIEVTHVSFRYRPYTSVVIQDVSFAIEPGQFVAFVGPSGCGKSTLLRLLLGFDQPDSGAVYYDGQDLTGLDLQALRRRIGVVLQSSTLTTGTILDNIIGVATNLGADAAFEACRMAGLQEDIRRLPMGLYTHIREGGVGLSGGQRQRILIARAIVARPRILLFDEASSALDNKTQAIVAESLRSLKSTRIVIAHRLSTIVDADRILVVERGRIVQQGTHNQLMSQGGLFGDLAKRQIA